MPRHPQTAARLFPGKGRVLQTGAVVNKPKKRMAPNPVGGIRKQQKSVTNVLGKAAMGRIISGCIQNQASRNMTDAPRATRSTPKAVITNARAARKMAGTTFNLREVAQDMMVTNFDCANDIAIHAKRVTVKAKDIELQRRILSKHGVL